MLGREMPILRGVPSLVAGVVALGAVLALELGVAEAEPEGAAVPPQAARDRIIARDSARAANFFILILLFIFYIFRERSARKIVFVAS